MGKTGIYTKLTDSTYPFDQAPLVSWPVYVKRLSSTDDFEQNNSEAKHIALC